MITAGVSCKSSASYYSSHTLKQNNLCWHNDKSPVTPNTRKKFRQPHMRRRSGVACRFKNILDEPNPCRPDGNPSLPTQPTRLDVHRTDNIIIMPEMPSLYMCVCVWDLSRRRREIIFSKKKVAKHVVVRAQTYNAISRQITNLDFILKKRSPMYTI